MMFFLSGVLIPILMAHIHLVSKLFIQVCTVYTICFTKEAILEYIMLSWLQK